MPTNSLDALRNLQQTRMQRAGYSSVDDDPSAQLYLMRDKLIPEVAHNLENEDRFAYQGLDRSPREFDGSSGIQMQPRMNYASGATHSDLAHLLGQQATSPIVSQGREVAETEAANRDAIMQGFGGTTNIATDRLPSGEVTGAMAAGPSGMPAQRAAQSQQAMSIEKMFMPLTVAREQGKNDIALEAAKTRNIGALNKQNYEMAHPTQGQPSQPSAPAKKYLHPETGEPLQVPAAQPTPDSTQDEPTYRTNFSSDGRMSMLQEPSAGAGGQLALQRARADSAVSMLNRLRGVHNQMQVGEGPGQLIKGGWDSVKGMLNMDNPATEYRKLRRATAVALAVAIQGSRPSDADADAMAELLPDFNTPKTVADDLFNNNESQLRHTSAMMKRR